MLFQQPWADVKKKYNGQGEHTPTKGFGQIRQVLFAAKYIMIAVKMIGSKKRYGR
jgi:hypothetical protein